MSTGFFDRYPAFYATSTTAAFPNRLNVRYRALIEHNTELIRGMRILDIGSHDGRWSFAALKNGAAHVVGIEGRDYLVKHAIHNMEQYGIDHDSYTFIVGDVHREIKTIPAGEIDVVFLFGFFYHTMRHTELLESIRHLTPKCLIIDTAVALSAEPTILLEFNNPDKEAAAIRAIGTEERMLVGRPSRLALEYLLRSAGFGCEYIDWQAMNPDSWEHLHDYHSQGRATVIARPLETSTT